MLTLWSVPSLMYHPIFATCSRSASSADMFVVHSPSCTVLPQGAVHILLTTVIHSVSSLAGPGGLSEGVLWPSSNTSLAHVHRGRWRAIALRSFADLAQSMSRKSPTLWPFGGVSSDAIVTPFFAFHLQSWYSHCVLAASWFILLVSVHSSTGVPAPWHCCSLVIAPLMTASTFPPLSNPWTRIFSLSIWHVSPQRFHPSASCSP